MTRAAARRGRLARGAAVLLLAGLPCAVPAQRFDAHRPPAAQPPAEAVGVDAGRVRHFVLEGPGGRRYRIQAAALGAPPARGYPVLYLLDGNAAMAALESARNAPPLRGSVLLVAVGYDTDAYFDTDARALDYTPPLPGGGPVADPRGRPGGGADAFLDFLQHRLMPRIAADRRVDARRQGVWGHSYGGLLALHALYARPGLFAFHAAASPALWWHAPLMDDEAAAYAAMPDRAPARLLLMAGGAERGGPGAKAAAPPAVGPSPAQALAERLRRLPGLQVRWRLFEGLNHGPVFSASLGPAIRVFVEDGAEP
ncbi:hypothetical protein ASG87_09575 [Frateuria sp. Soil773]|uniref:alpha/beta hydrolase n=1 Tax=Frateuria sp. Soil773 TaxID=1736407 RepID=UPI0006F2C0F2|nr:alpha/beta hydrolase-fold protein [Frateuria sp. Soil773]KRE88807.1 hypothetical protein ASG87_09575 [Frateuria sp. Soil773]